MAKGDSTGKYGGGKERTTYDIDVLINQTYKNGKRYWELRRADNNRLIKSWQNPDSPRNYANKMHYNLI